jgi:hypothetical protein
LEGRRRGLEVQTWIGDELQDDLELAEEYQPLGNWRLDRMLEETRQTGLDSTVDVGPLANPCPRLEEKEQKGREE